VRGAVRARSWTGAQLAGADLTEACLGGTHFMAVDLEGAALDRGRFQPDAL
jgi:uncharacterized protein YjbI with pentapeptide repeats